MRFERLQTFLSLLVLFSLLNLTGCGGCNLITAVPVNVSIAIKDPVFAKVFECTQELDLLASGRLKPGRYRIKGAPIEVSEGTQFTLWLKLPNRATSVINLKEATGKFTSTKEIKFHGVPMPKSIELSNGSVSGDIQFIRSLGAFLIELVNQQVSPVGQNASDIAGMAEEIHIRSLVLRLRPGSKLQLPGLSLVMADGSTLSLKDLECDNRWNYTGEGDLALNLSAGSCYYSQKGEVLIELGVGKVTSRLAVSCKEGIAELRSIEGGVGTDEIATKALTMTAVSGQSKSVVASGAAQLSGLDWSLIRTLGKPEAHCKVSGKMTLSAVSVQMTRPDLDVQFKLPAQLQLAFSVEQAGQDSTFRVNSPEALESKGIKLSLKRPGGPISILLDRAAIGCDLSSGPDLVKITLPKGEFEPRQIEWGRESKRVVMTMPAGTKLSLVRDVAVALKPASQTFDGAIPLVFRGGAVSIKGAQQYLGLENVTGSMMLNIKNNAIDAVGKLNTTLTVDGKTAGGVTKCGIAINSVHITSSSDGVLVVMEGCRIAIPRSYLEKTLRASLPAKRSFSVNKEMLEGSRWRYRNLTVRSATVSQPNLQQFKFTGSDKMSFVGEADVFAQGTVERSSAVGLLAIATGEGTWSVRPWSAKTHVKGIGNVAFQFNPGSSLADSSLTYDAVLNLSVPEQLDLDWSQVSGSGDMLARTEKTVVSGALKMAQFCLPEDELALRRSGKITPFSKAGAQLRSLKVESVSVRTVGDQLLLGFRSSVKL